MRREREVTIEKEGRDKGKTFLITEMSATKAEKWAMRVLFAIGASGVNLPEGLKHLKEAGMAGVAILGIDYLLKIRWDLAEPLIDEMFECIRIKEPKVTRRLTENDIEEVATRILLRREAFDLHTGFSWPANEQTSTSTSETLAGSQNTGSSPQQSPPSSQAA